MNNHLPGFILHPLWGDGRKAVKQVGEHVRKSFESQNEYIYVNLVGIGE